MERRFYGFTDIQAVFDDLPPADVDRRAEAKARNAALTKPPGALGRLEDLAIWHAGWRSEARVAAPQVVVFAGNHGVAARGVSAFPQEVTAQMVANFRSGGAAINQMAALAGAAVEVHALDLDRPTADFTAGPAMTPEDLGAAFGTGWASVSSEADLLVCGEMGIGNTTPAAALAAHLWGGDPRAWVGAGTGVTGDRLASKQDAVQAGCARHADAGPLAALAALGGRELAAIAGAVLRARHQRIPVILDGFITCAAASVLERARPGALDHTVAGHLSEEAGHRRLLEALGKPPLLSLGMRLGEGTGAALAIQVLRGALACQTGMASFDEAGVSAR